MMSFVLSQLLGFIIFTVVNFSLFCYLAYKRNQAFRVDSPKSTRSYRLGFFLLLIFFIGGVSLKGYHTRETFLEMSVKRPELINEKSKPKAAENPS
jgi:capsule polysaccharide export protein KpsE/RkpR